MSRVLLIRHAEKADSKNTGVKGELSLKGRDDALVLGKVLRITSKSPDSITFSGLKRAKETAELIKKGAKTEAPITEDQRLRYPGKFSQKFGKYLESLGSEEKMIAGLIVTADKRPDPESWSSQEIGIGLWSLIAEKMKQDGTHILISHSGMIENLEAFLKGSYNFSAIGGPVAYLEGIEVIYEESRISIRFRKVLSIFGELGFGELSAED